MICVALKTLWCLLFLLLQCPCGLCGTVAPPPTTTTQQQESLEDMVDMSDTVVWGNVMSVITGDLNIAYVDVYCTLIGPKLEDNITIGDAVDVCNAPDDCVFPFMYNDVIYEECTSVNNHGRHWCSHSTHYIWGSGGWSDCQCEICNRSIECFISELVPDTEYVFFLLGSTSLQTLYRPLPYSDELVEQIADSCSYLGGYSHTQAEDKECPSEDLRPPDCPWRPEYGPRKSTFAWSTSTVAWTASTAVDSSPTSHATYAYHLGGEGVAHEITHRPHMDNQDFTDIGEILNNTVMENMTTGQPINSSVTNETTLEPMNLTVTIETTEEPMNSTATNQTTEEPMNSTATNQTTEEPMNSTATNQTTEEPMNSTATNQTTEEPINSTVTNETTEEPMNSTVTNETTEEPINSTVTNETTKEPINSTVTNETTEEPINSTVTNITTEEPINSTVINETTEGPMNSTRTNETTEESINSTVTNITTEEPMNSTVSTTETTLGPVIPLFTVSNDNDLTCSSSHVFSCVSCNGTTEVECDNAGEKHSCTGDPQVTVCVKMYITSMVTSEVLRIMKYCTDRVTASTLVPYTVKTNVVVQNLVHNMTCYPPGQVKAKRDVRNVKLWSKTGDDINSDRNHISNDITDDTD